MYDTHSSNSRAHVMALCVRVATHDAGFAVFVVVIYCPHDAPFGKCMTIRKPANPTSCVAARKTDTIVRARLLLICASRDTSYHIYPHVRDAVIDTAAPREHTSHGGGQVVV